MSEDWFIKVQESIIAHKQEMIRLVSKMVSEKIILRDQLTDSGLRFEMEHDIQELHVALKKVAESVNLNRRMIRVRREELRLRNSQFIGAENKAGPEEGTRAKVDK